MRDRTLLRVSRTSVGGSFLGKWDTVNDLLELFFHPFTWNLTGGLGR